MLVLGLGLGLVMQVLVIAVQNAVDHSDLGVATSSAMFFRSLGASFGIALFGAILTSRLASELASVLPPGSSIGAQMLTGSPAVIAQLPAAVREPLVTALSHAITSVFAAAIPFAILGFALVVFLPELPLRDVAHMQTETPT
jgi:hypothetical protein